MAEAVERIDAFRIDLGTQPDGASRDDLHQRLRNALTNCGVQVDDIQIVDSPAAQSGSTPPAEAQRNINSGWVCWKFEGRTYCVRNHIA